MAYLILEVAAAQRVVLEQTEVRMAVHWETGFQSGGHFAKTTFASLVAFIFMLLTFLEHAILIILFLGAPGSQLKEDVAVL